MKKKATMLFLLVSLLTTSKAQAGWIVKSEITRPGTSPYKTITYYQNGKFATVTPLGTTTIDASKGLIIQINPWQRTYSRITAERMGKIIKEMQKRVRSQLKGLPPDKKAQLERELGITSTPPKITVEEIGVKVLLGHRCKVYQIDLNGEKAMRLWIAMGVKPFSPETEQFFRRTMDKAFPEIDRELGIFRLERTEEFKKLTRDGLVMKIVDYRDGSIVKVIEIKQVKLPDSVFSPPPGYKEVPFEKLKQPPMER